ncbi:hypothetical protein ACWOFR_05150 [Carnobacterium gallinarum]|uniref:hypothetical protein n=1 Tax=Carnobacterium gallinarum TaxID=2749 RepID=UPI00055731D7|nr:hypothetical protein [Carnobacterium gallinarum]
MENNYTSLGKVKTGLTVVQGIFVFGVIYSAMNLISQVVMMSQTSTMMSADGVYTPGIWDQFFGIFMQITGYLGIPGSVVFSILAFLIATFSKEIVGRVDQHESLYTIENARTVKKMSLATISMGAVATILVIVGLVAKIMQQQQMMNMEVSDSTVYQPKWYDNYDWIFRSEISGGLVLIIGYIGVYLALQGIAAFFEDKASSEKTA